MNILFLINHYNNSEEVYNYLRHLKGFTETNSNLKINVSICDNSSNLNIDINLFSTKNFELLKNTPSENLGYLNGCFYAYQSFSIINNINVIDIIAISNTDISLDNNFFHVLSNIKLIDDNILAPDITLYKNSTKQNPYIKQRWSLLHLLLNYLRFSNIYLHRFLINMRIKRTLVIYKQNVIINNIYAAHGSFILLSAKIIDTLINNKLEHAFMFHEELFIAEESRLKNYKIFYCDELKLTHNENATTSLLSTKYKLKLRRESTWYIIKKYYLNIFD